MEIIADLHLHSKYSRAVSQQMILPEIGRWAGVKGIGLVATGDWTHPMWLREIRENLEEIGNGLLKLKVKSEKLKVKNQEESSRATEPLFILSTEISSIYSQGGRPRRIHTLFMVPSLAAAERINSSLSKRGGNLLSDGRPIVGLSAKELTDIILNLEPKAMIIPGHVWTPWFSLYGSKSGFDSLDECFGSLGQYIYAVETGLSSDPMMNWQIRELRQRQIVSFSDAHSGAKLGREATVFKLKVKSEKLKVILSLRKTNLFISYEDIYKAIKGEADGKWEIGYTIEFYPEEGKYHYTGHRNCGVVQSPEQTARRGTNCHVCGKPLTIGVMHRVQQLAKGALAVMEEREEMRMTEDKFGVKWVLPPKEQTQHRPFISLVPLIEILAEVFGSGVNTQTVINEYQRLIDNLGTEFEILLKTPVEKLIAVAGEKIAQAIRRVRQRQINVSPGYDGVFGVVSIFGKAGNGPEKREQMSLF